MATPPVSVPTFAGIYEFQDQQNSLESALKALEVVRQMRSGGINYSDLPHLNVDQVRAILSEKDLNPTRVKPFTIVSPSNRQRRESGYIFDAQTYFFTNDDKGEQARPLQEIDDRIELLERDEQGVIVPDKQGDMLELEGEKMGIAQRLISQGTHGTVTYNGEAYTLELNG